MTAAEGCPEMVRERLGERPPNMDGDVLRKGWWRIRGTKGLGEGRRWGKHPRPTRRSHLNSIPISGLTVPFLSFMNAEMAHIYLTQDEESLEEAVHRELTVTGSDRVM